jgi:two-component system sensor histidine kinase UhpB
MLLALWFSTRQVVQPLRTLEAKAGTLAMGDFKSIQEPVGGIAEIQHLQGTLAEMALKVQDAQRSLHGYIGAITTAQEEERHRLARELHDDTLQALIALKQRVQLAQLEFQSAKAKDAPEMSELDEVASLTEQTIENLRRLTRALRPIYLEDLGLVPALEMLARETGQAMGIPVEFHRQGMEKRLDPAVELALYRIAQEALNNIARHAQAKHAIMSISFTPASTSMQVEDDGVGFDVPKNPSEYTPSGHFGLLGLHERAELIGAKLQIQSSPGKGTRLTVTLFA